MYYSGDDGRQCDGAFLRAVSQSDSTSQSIWSRVKWQRIMTKTPFALLTWLESSRNLSIDRFSSGFHFILNFYVYTHRDCVCVFQHTQTFSILYFFFKLFPYSFRKETGNNIQTNKTMSRTRCKNPLFYTTPGFSFKKGG